MANLSPETRQKFAQHWRSTLHSLDTDVENIMSGSGMNVHSRVYSEETFHQSDVLHLMESTIRSHFGGIQAILRNYAISTNSDVNDWISQSTMDCEAWIKSWVRVIDIPTHEKALEILQGLPDPYDYIRTNCNLIIQRPRT